MRGKLALTVLVGPLRISKSDDVAWKKAAAASGLTVTQMIRVAVRAHVGQIVHPRPLGAADLATVAARAVQSLKEDN